MPDEIDDPVEQSIALRRFDLHSMWRVLLWGASAAMAVAIVAGTAFSELGTERLQQAFASLIEPAKTDKPQVAQLAAPQVAQAAAPQVTQQVTPQQIAALEQQARELTQTVHDLTAERDQVKARLASLEQSLNDITGAIKAQTAQAGQFAAQLAAQLPAHVAPASAAQKPAAAPPAVSAPPTVAAIASPKATTTATETPAVTASTPPAAGASPPIAVPIPLPPRRVAALEPPDDNAVTRELGVDLGGAATLERLRSYWAGIKANIGPDLVGLIPSYTIRQKQTGASDYRLILGPLPSSAAAIRLCAKLSAGRAYCRPGTFSVYRLGERQAERPRTAEQLPAVPRNSIIWR